MRIAIVDLELTQPEESIIEIGAVAVDMNGENLEVLSEFQTYCYSNIPVTDYITDLTGITQDEISNAPSLYQGLDGFWNWFKDQKVSKNLGAWGTDAYMMMNQSKKLGIKVPRFYSFNIKTIANFMKRAKFGAKAKGGLRKSLDDLVYPSYNYTQHRAVEDSKATAVLMHNMYHRIKKYWKMEELFNGRS